MPEDDAKIFQDAFAIYNKYRWTEMTSPEQWMAFSEDVRDFARAYNWARNPLAKRIAQMLLDLFNDLYKGGKKPAIPDYFGRSDL